MKTHVASLGLLLALSAAALAQQGGYSADPLGIDALRRQVMSRHFGPADRPDPPMVMPPSPAPGRQDLEEQIWSEWGVALAPVPRLLQMHCPVLEPDAGLLITKVRSGSPAERAGLVEGHVLAGAENKWFLSPRDLPRLIEPRTLAVLVAGRLEEVEILPDCTPLSTSDPAAPIHRAPPRVSALSSSTAHGAGEAISMAAANGVFQIEASYASPEGRKKVHLSGTRKQIEQSLTELPDSVRRTIEDRLRMVAPEEPAH